MEKKKLIKILQGIKGNPEIGINVLTENCSSEFWSLGKSMIKLMDNGESLAIFQCRLRKAIPSRVLMNLNLSVVDGVNVELKEIVKRFKEKFDLQLPADYFDKSDVGVQQALLTILHAEIEELVRLNEDFIRLCGNKKEHQKYHYIIQE